MLFRGSAMRFPHAQGLFRETLLVPAYLPYHVGSGVEAGLAALAEPFAVCLHAVKQAGWLLGKTVQVSGCGPIGCLIVAAARLAGAHRVIACDVVAEPLKVAERLGANEIVINGPDSTSYKEGKGRIDVAFDCSGHPAAVATAIECLRPAARSLRSASAALCPSRCPSRYEGTRRCRQLPFDAQFGEAVGLISSGGIDLAPLISYTYQVEQATEAFDLAGDRNHAMKVQLAFEKL